MVDGLTQYMESHRFRTLEELKAKRPMEFSSEEARLNTIVGLSPDYVLSDNAESDLVLKSDQWGHLVK